MSLSKSRKVHPRYYRQHLQAIFIYWLAKNPRFDEEVDPLRRLWAAALEHPKAPKSMSDLPWESVCQGDPTLRTYRDNLERVVMQEFRCRVDGRPAQWVCRCIHDVVRSGLAVVVNVPDMQGHFMFGEVVLSAMTVGRASVGAKVNGELLGDVLEFGIDDQGQGDENAVALPSIGTFEEWDALRRAAYERVDAVVTELKRRQDILTDDWIGVYLKGHQTRLERTMPILVSWLVDRELYQLGERTSATQLRKDLGLDPIGNAKK